MMVEGVSLVAVKGVKPVNSVMVGGVAGASLGQWRVYEGTSLMRNCLLLGPYSRTMPRALWLFYGGSSFL